MLRVEGVRSEKSEVRGEKSEESKEEDSKGVVEWELQIN